MRQSLTRQWYIPLIRGLFAILFGVIALIFPGLTLATLVYLFAAYAIVEGVMNLYQAFSSRDNNTHWGWSLFEGLVALAAGIGAFFLPQITGITLLFLIAFFAIFTGIAEIVAAIRLRKEIDNEIWLGLSGIVSLIFGGFILFDPLGGALATAWLIGLYAIAFGGMLVALAFRLRNTDEEPRRDIHQQQTEPMSTNA